MRRQLSSQNFKWIRNFIMIAEMIVLFILWLSVPSIIKNSNLLHVGNGAYGPGFGFLIIVPLPLMGLLHGALEHWDNDKEIHTDDIEEKLRLEERRKTESLRVQILLSALCFVLGCIGIILAIFQG